MAISNPRRQAKKRTMNILKLKTGKQYRKWEKNKGELKKGREIMFKLGQKVSYKKIIRKIMVPYMESKDFNEEEVIEKDRTKSIELTKERSGFIVGTRNIAKKGEYIFEDDDPDQYGHVVHQKTETIKVYKVAYDMAHTNFVLEEDLMRVEK